MQFKSVEEEAPQVKRIPHNIEAEQALLGAIFIQNEAYQAVADFCAGGHFFDPFHGAVFDTIGTIIKGGGVASPVSMAHMAEGWGQIGEISAKQYLFRLAANATTIINAPNYARLIVELWRRRQLILLAEDVLEEAYQTSEPIPGIISKAEGWLYDLQEKSADNRQTTLRKAAQEAAEAAHAAHVAGSGLAGLATGFKEIDKELRGLGRGQLIILAGRPSMGKSALALQIAEHAAKQQNVPAAFFSMEMTSLELATRMIGQESLISSQTIRSGRFKTEEWRGIDEASKRVGDIPIYIDQSGGVSVSGLSFAARRYVKRNNVGLVVVDYLQLMRGSSKRGDRVEDVTEITTGLKALAKDLQIPIIALSQLNRAVESRDNKRPLMSDLRDSGSIEQDADVILFVFREEYYLERSEPQKGSKDYANEYSAWQARCDAARGKAEIIIAKQRNGPVGLVRLLFNASLTRFSDGPPDDRRRP